MVAKGNYMWHNNSMLDTTNIRILEKENNRRGDLFGRLMADLFVALGYKQPRMNIPKSGRELDLYADHRLEPRRAIAECKATADPIGGKELNTLDGKLNVERGNEHSITGYFISVAGFTETAIEQEKSRPEKIVLLNGPQVVSELVNGRIIIGKVRATEISGRCCAGNDHLVLDPNAELLAHERGWIWAVYYTHGKSRTHFALIHADGTPLASVLAEEVITADSICEGELHKLTCLNPAPPIDKDSASKVEETMAAYRRYLAEECGFIHLDGLPADAEVGSRRLKLENLFVPLHLDVTDDKDKVKQRQPVGEVLAEHPRLAILASPGGGKSTLIKRIAVAYSDPERRGQIADNLPDRDWFPLFFRCRELRELTRGSFAELIEALSQREPVRQHAEAFRACVDRALLAGRVLLLVDGLDEISDSGDRAAFVCMLRTAIQAYRGTALIVTSREAGFRHVAAHLAAVCTQATVSSFNADDISRLSVAWHREVVGDTEKVRGDAEQLAATISQNDRILRLAVNPLLLTTLLLVKRWVGSLPTRRTVLYDKAVEVLLMTWNTEGHGHDAIPLEEALPQLCYVASAMMLAGVQKISRPRLTKLLQEARDALPSELGYVQGSVDEFIRRVEDRSSLLMMTGHDVEDGRLVEFFEFRHLTFQEFLTARAMVQGWHRGREETDTLTTVLEPHFRDEKWREVIPLAAVLGGRATDALIQRLTERVKQLKAEHPLELSGNTPFLALGHCLADEAAARPETIRAAVLELLRFGEALELTTFAPMLVRGRYGTLLQGEAEKALLAPTADISSNSAESALAEIVYWQTIESEDSAGYAKAAEQFVQMLMSGHRLDRCKGALGCMSLCYRVQKDSFFNNDLYCNQDCIASLQEAGTKLVSMLFSNDPIEQHSAALAFVWLGEQQFFPPPGKPDLLGRLFVLGQTGPHDETRRIARNALVAQSLASREDGGRCSSIPSEMLHEAIQSYDLIEKKVHEQFAVLIVAWYMRWPWSDSEIAARVTKLRDKKQQLWVGSKTFDQLLDRLGVERK